MTKKTILTYLGGVLTGIVLTVVFALAVGSSGNGSAASSDITMFDEPQEFYGSNFKVFQVIDKNSALATQFLLDTVVLIVSDEENSFYDNQWVDAENKRVLQIGTYRYKTRENIWKTVPVVRIVDK